MTTITNTSEITATKVLIVEDNPGDALLVEASLECAAPQQERFAIRIAEDLAGAVAMLRQDRPDVVMLDLNLPDSTGLETVRRFRALAGDVPIVVMSGHSAEVGFDAMEIGAQDYLLKGEASASQLRRALHHAISRHNIAVRLQESESRFHSLFSHARVPMVCAGLDGWFVEANEAFCELTGYTHEQLLTMRGADLAPPRTRDIGTRALRELHDGGADATTFEGELVRADGAVRQVVVTAGTVRDSAGATLYTSAVIHDVTAQREAQRLAAASERRFHSLVEHVSDVISVHDADGRLLFTSPSGPRLLGLESGAVGPGADIAALVHRDDLTRVADAFRNWVDGRPQPVQYRLQRGDGTWVQCESVATNLLDDPAVAGVVVTTRDISDRQRALDDLSYQAMHDSLTGLPNRSLFHDRLSQAIARHRRAGSMLGVLFLDLDNFKYINDSHGHQVGDEVLLAAAAVLAASIRPEDTIARLGGDEFAVVCEDVADITVARALAERLQDALRAPFAVGDLLIHVSASIGIAIAAVDGLEYTATDLLRDADAALYQAKDRGRARAEVFDDELRRRAVRRLKVEEALRTALDRDELEVRYQPQFSVASGALTGFEALLRWTHPTLGPVGPDEFIPIAESGGLIHAIGRWVLDQACGQVAQWRARYPERDVTMAVNLSARQIADERLIDAVRETLERHEVGSGLCLEVTETVLMEDAPTSVATLRRLKDLGVRIAIDDFGTGYSSLAYLKRFPIDYLKVDRTFVAGLGRDPEDTVIVASVIDLAGRLGLDVVAEGVETQAQLDELHVLGCGYAQGYLRGAATPAAEAEEHLRTPIGPKAAPVERTVTPEVRPVDADEARSGVDDAVAMLANELRTPLTVIRGFAETLEELVAQGREDVLHRAVLAITRQTSGMESLLASLGDLRRLEEGALTLRRSPTDLATVVTGAVGDVAAAGFAAPVDVVVHPCPQVAGDAGRLRQVLANLLTNAAQHTPPGARVDVVLEHDATAATATVRVIDRGPGVPESRVPALFRKFSRLDTTRKGSGLGLYLARSLARAHGGDVRYRRAETGGAEFVLTLPVSANAKAPAVATSAARPEVPRAAAPVAADEPPSVERPAAAGRPEQPRPIRMAAPKREVPAPAVEDADAQEATHEATCGLVRATSPEEVVGVAIVLVQALGGRVVTAAAADRDAIPIDLSFGVGDPLLPVAEPLSLPRMRLERALPFFIEDARSTVHALRHRDRSEQGEGTGDPVTGLWNGRGLSAWMAEQPPLRSVAVLELEGLDCLRADAGDAEADRVLRELSRAVRGLLAPGDAAVRTRPQEIALVSSRRAEVEMADLVDRLGVTWLRTRPNPLRLAVGVVAAASDPLVGSLVIGP